MAILSPLGAFFGKMWWDKIRHRRAVETTEKTTTVDFITSENHRLHSRVQELEELNRQLYERLISTTETLAAKNRLDAIAVERLRAARKSHVPAPSHGSEKTPRSDTPMSSTQRLPPPPRPFRP